MTTSKTTGAPKCRSACAEQALSDLRIGQSREDRGSLTVPEVYSRKAGESAEVG